MSKDIPALRLKAFTRLASIEWGVIGEDGQWRKFTGLELRDEAADLVKWAIGEGCSFCGKDKSATQKLVAGKAAMICDECVDVCKDVLADPSHPRIISVSP